MDCPKELNKILKEAREDVSYDRIEREIEIYNVREIISAINYKINEVECMFGMKITHIKMGVEIYKTLIKVYHDTYISLDMSTQITRFMGFPLIIDHHNPKSLEVLIGFEVV